MVTSIVVFLLSATLLAGEVALMRVFAITQWSHFAYLVISIALLGFGASGTLVTVGGAWLRRRERTAVPILASLFAVALPICCDLAQRADLNVLALPWSGRQMWLLAAVALILMVPFLLGAAAIVLLLSASPARSPHLYAANLLGSGVGALGVVWLLWVASPGGALLILCGVMLAGSGLAWCRHGQRLAAAGIAGSAAVAAALVAWWHSGSDFPALRVSEFKALPITLNLPDIERRAHALSPMGQLDVVASPVIREVPGLSFAFRGTPPPQMLVFTDADAPSAVNLWRDRDDLRCFDYVTQAAGFHVRPPARMCVIGAGGGTDLDLAHYHGVQKVCAVELNGRLLDVLAAARGWPGTPYDPRVMPSLDLVIAEGRGHLERTRDRYDLIQISLVDSFSASSAGVYALSESYLYTVEALRAYLNRLTPEGTLSLTRWLKRPPRDVIKLFATAVEALEAEGLDPRDRLILIRSWKTATLLVTRQPFTAQEVGRLRTFCHQRNFDLAYSPGIRAGEANRFHVYEQPVYYEAAQAILFGDRRGYIEGSFFDLRPATDDRPFFFHFFRPRMLPRVRETLGRNWRPFVEWGYVVVLVTLAAAAVPSAVLILAPLALVRSRMFLRVPRPALSGRAAFGVRSDPTRPDRPGHPSSTEDVSPCATADLVRPCGPRRSQRPGRPLPPARRHRPAVVGYCLALGLGFMFIEMAFIQKFILFLSHPLYAVSVIIAGFLVLAGVGSWLAGRFEERSGRAVAVAVGLIAAVSLAYALWLTPLLRHLIGWPDWARVVTTLVLLVPLAVPMGVPFPTALRRLGGASPTLVPWAWAINGCASVTAASLATALAVSFGFRVVVVTAVVLYCLAGVLFSRLPAAPRGKSGDSIGRVSSPCDPNAGMLSPDFPH